MTARTTEAIVEQWLENFGADRHDIDTLVADMDEQCVSLWYDGTAVSGRKTIEEEARSSGGTLRGPFATYSEVESLVVGEAGVVWGRYRLTLELPGIGPAAISGRFSATADWTGERWRWMVMHFESPLSTRTDAAHHDPQRGP